MKLNYHFFIGLILVAGLTACNNQPEPLSWNFAEQNNYTYSYLKNEETIVTGENFTGTRLYKTEGDLEINTNGKGYASLALQNGLRTTYTPDTDGSILDSFIVPTKFTIDRITTDGGMDRHDENSSIPLELLLRLPTKTPNEGEKIEEPITLRVFDGKEAYGMKGKGLYTFTGYKEVNGYNCAEIKANITFDYENTNERNKIKINTTADVTYYFSVDKHRLVQGTITFSQKVIPVPEDKKISLFWSDVKEETTNVELTVKLKENN